MHDEHVCVCLFVWIDSSDCDDGILTGVVGFGIMCVSEYSIVVRSDCWCVDDAGSLSCIDLESFLWLLVCCA